MRILYLKVYNFLSWKFFSFDFRDELFKKPLLIFGENGEGKSAIFEAICWVLYGKLIRERDSKVSDEIVNKFVGSNCKVIIGIEINNEIFEIRRYRKHDKMGNRINLFSNEGKLAIRGLVECQNYINNKIGLDYKSFKNTSIFVKDANSFFSSSSNSEQVKTIESVLGLEKYDEYVDRTRKKINVLKDKIEVDSNRGSEITKHIYRLKQIINSQRDESMNVLNEELNVKRNLLKVKKDNIIRLKKDKDDFNENKYNDILKDLEIKNDNVYELRNRCMTYDKKKRELEEEIGDLKSAIKRPNSVLEKGSFCPTCKRLIDNNALVEYVKYATVRLSKIEVNYDMVMRERDKTNDKLSSLLKEVNRLRENKNSIEVEILSFNRKLNKERALRDSLREEIDYIKEQISKISDNKDNNSKIVKRGIRKGREELEEIDKSIKKTNRLIRIYEFYEKAFPKIRNYIFNSFIDPLNERVNHYLFNLSDGIMEAEIDNLTLLNNGDLRDKFSIKLTINNMIEDFIMSSEGQKVRFDLSALFSFRDLAIMNARSNLGIILADEIFDKLDEKGIINVMNLLREISKEGVRIIVISHSNVIKDRFKSVGNILEVNMKNGISNIKENKS